MVDQSNKSHSKKHYVIVFGVLFLIVVGVLIFLLDRTVGIQTLLNPSAGVDEEVQLKKTSANRVIKNRRYMIIEQPIAVTLRDEQQRPVFLSISLTFELQLDADESQIETPNRRHQRQQWSF